ncbi:MAG: galK [Nocardioidaceae bacterium]|nr:galK [Nocardioidaceae bacterium]
MTEVPQWQAPGRVNLIGEHLDYNGGPVLPMAINRRTTVKARQRDDDLVRVWTTHDGNQRAEFRTDVAPHDVSGWASYAAAMFWALAQDGHQIDGFDLVLDSDVPAGAGLSSSAAIECAIGLAVCDLSGITLDPIDLALLAQRAENDFIGVPSGAMDQLASMCGKAGHAVFIDFGTERPTVREVEATWAQDDLALLVIDTKAHHALADGEYAARRTECEEAAKELGIERLAKAGPDAVLRLEDETLKKRTRHVITETARTRGAIRALSTRNWTQFGAMLTASHASLRDDFDVSCPELDVAVSASLEAGALGARMTGGGFGGSAIALVARDGIAGLRERVEAQFSAHQWTRPEAWVVEPAAGASTMDV